ncbi:MAG: N-6 DNA methylase, partial [Planctomycetes bacterium]|nr:N-6 DNA methylase [Planctomycetota bacterium]
MQTRSRDIFATIRTEGALLPADLLQRISEGDGDLEGLKPADYHLGETEKLNEAISRSWNRLLAVWNGFNTVVNKLPEKDLGTTATREKWLLPLFQELGYGRLPTSKAVDIEGKSYPISHFWQPAPIHLIGCRVDIDRRTAGVAGAARVSPHGLVQEFLNRSDDHLWAFVSNGLRLRILRDNISLTRQAFVEFDLAGMMDGEVYSDFILLWLLCHQSRVEVPEDKTPEHCWLEKWSQAAQKQGTRALDQLRNGVEEAIKSLGSGFLSHLANTELKDKLKKGTLDKQDYYRQLLRIVYRLIFIFVSEDRGLLFDPKADQHTKDFYMQHYSATRLRKLAQNKRGTRHYDLWRGLSLVFDKLGSKEGCPELALPALGSFLWSKDAIADLDGCDISNRDFLEAVRALAFTIDNNVLRAVDYKNLGSEELGSVYESLLELHPELNVDVGTFELTTAAGHERKTTGSYYTHSSLVNCLLDSALEPVLDEAVKKDNPEKAILNLKVCDPATGSGHFLVAAAHRMAKRLAAFRTGDDEPSPEATHMALRDVIGHCIYGVDMNPMAVELCKVSLWLEALEPGKPLSFLDHHIKYGNSLLGTTPALMADGIPDDAFKPIEGDDKVLCREFKKQNKDERKGQAMLFYGTRPWDRLGNLPVSMLSIDEMPDDTVEAVEQKRKKYAEIVNSTSYKFGQLLADTWCAAFVFPKTKQIDYPITEKIFSEIEQNPHNIALWMEEEISRLKKQYQFFHWHLEFPDVFRIPAENEAPENEQTGWSGGFDCVLGNPPWDQIQLDPREFFATRNLEIANAAHMSARKKMIEGLKSSDPNLYNLFKAEQRHHEGVQQFIHTSNLYPLTSYGRLTLAPLFAELTRNIKGNHG